MTGTEEITTKESKPDFKIKVKRTVRDSVFHDLFEDRKYALQLYQAIHPEDMDATEADIEDVTINNIFTDQEYNDLGMTVRGKLLLMLECQSAWSVNIVVRILLCLAYTWNEHLETTRQNRYGSKRVRLPKPEFYVIYTGKRKKRTDWICLSDEFFEGDKRYLDVKVRVLYGDGSRPGRGRKDIISQYVDFTKVYGEQVKRYGRTRKAVMKTIRKCRDNDVLREYLSNREKEVIDIMMALFDQQKAVEQFGYEKMKEGERKGQREGKIEGQREAAFNMKAAGLAEGTIAQFLGVGSETVRQWLAGTAPVRE